MICLRCQLGRTCRRSLLCPACHAALKASGLVWCYFGKHVVCDDDQAGPNICREHARERNRRYEAARRNRTAKRSYARRYRALPDAPHEARYQDLETMRAVLSLLHQAQEAA